MKFWLRRLLGFAGTLLGVSALTFALVSAVPGDLLSDAEMNPQVSEATLRAMRERLRSDEAWPVRYGSWLVGVVRGDWGVSLISGLPVRDLVAARVANTLALAVLAQIAAWLLSAALAMQAVSRPRGWADLLGEWLANLLLCIPEVALTLLLMLFLGSRLGAAAVPVAALAALTLAAMPPVWRQMRAAGSRAMELPFVEAARANGVAPAVVWWRYVLPAAAVPLISFAGASIGGLISASLVVECVTGYGGLGPLMLDAVLARDLPVVAATVLLTATLWLLGGLLSDAALYVVDPRMRVR